jgi:hypothetical protein
MPKINTGVIGFDVEYTMDGVIFNDVVYIKRPRACSVTDWQAVWQRLEYDYGLNERIEKDGYAIVDLDE